MLAQILADSQAQTPTWLTVVLSAFASMIAVAITLALGIYTLSRTEAYRRASRWEPRAEKLWDERIKLYPTILGPLTNLTKEIRGSGTTPLPADKVALMIDVSTAAVPLLLTASSNVSGAIGNIFDALAEYAESGISDLGKFNSDVEDKLFALINAMREDVHLAHLDKQTQGLFD
jgi:hypothetical protein